MDFDLGYGGNPTGYNIPAPDDFFNGEASPDGTVLDGIRDTSCFSSNLSVYRSSLRGKDLTAAAHSIVEYALSLDADEPVIRCDHLTLPMPGAESSVHTLNVQSGLNAAYVVGLNRYFRNIAVTDSRPRQVLLVGAGGGGALNCLAYQKPHSLPLSITIYDVADARGGKLDEFISLPSVRENHSTIRVLRAVGDPIKTPLPGLWDIVIFSSNIHRISGNKLTMYYDMLAQGGIIMGLYPDARKAPYLESTPGFKYEGRLENGDAIINVFGKSYADPPFDPPAFPGAVVTHIGHQEYVNHEPWVQYVPRRMRPYTKGGIGKLFNYYSVEKKSRIKYIVPELIDTTSLDFSEKCPYSRKEFTKYYDRPIGLTNREVREYFGTTRWYYKEKNNGRSCLFIRGPHGDWIYDVERDAFARAGPKQYVDNVLIVAQYELLNDVMSLCSINGVVTSGDTLPINFEVRHSDMRAWFSNTWHPLETLTLPVPYEEGIIMTPASSVGVSFRHRCVLTGEYGTVGISRWVKRRPTVDVSDVNGATIEVDLYSGQIVRTRHANKAPNDHVRLCTMFDLVSLEVVASLAASNGRVFTGPILDDWSEEAVAEVPDSLSAWKYGDSASNQTPNEQMCSLLAAVLTGVSSDPLDLDDEFK